MTLPNGVNLVVEDKKVREYLLSTTHPIGRVKASFFGTLGFGPEKPTELATALVIHVADGEVMDREPTLYGTKYVVEGQLHGSDGSAWVRSIWIADRLGGTLRLVTAYPATKKESEK